MKYKTIIFDLFGTLVDSVSLEEHRKVMAQMASVLSIPSKDFQRLWMDTSFKRATGVFQDKQANIEHICDSLGVPVEPTQIELAARISIDATKRLMKPRPCAIEVLSSLKSEGYKIGLISNCSPEVPSIWEDTPLANFMDAVVFSCLVGLAKPAPDIYRLTIEKLAVEPGSCLYIGDGTSHELEGASQAGMHPVLILVPDEESNNPYRNISVDWDGPTISSLCDILPMLLVK